MESEMPRRGTRVAPDGIAPAWIALGLVALAGALLVTGCAKPQPDLDGKPAGAVPLELDSWRSDQLFCRTGDCSDWYRIQLRERGDLEVDAVTPEGGERSFTLSLVTSGGEILTRTASAGSGRAQISWATSAGTYLIELTTTDQARRALAYDIQARFEPAPPPPPPPPPPEIVSAEVIEVEGAPEPNAVLIDKGRDAGLTPGLRGRLVQDGQEIGRIEVQDVYPEGSRLRISGPLTAPITPKTQAEIEIPPGRGRSGSTP
jgi:hypothetical protein